MQEQINETGQGSSPRRRGAPRQRELFQHPGRIIPAYAGSTSGGRTRVAPGQDHPRVCGEHSTSDTRQPPLTGSSPRMRGAPGLDRVLRLPAGIIPAYAGSTFRYHDIRSCRLNRIIPAYAGSTCWAPTVTTTSKDHPRVCGEHRAEEARRL